MSDMAWSAPATSRRVLDLLSDIDWPGARIVDVGAGRGHFVRLVAEALRARDLDADDRVFACDVVPESFEVEEISCRPIAADGRLPFADGQFDAVVSIEVIEHVEDPFFFWRELARIAKPRATIVVTTPNVLNVNSRLRTLFTGFPLLFDPLPLDRHDPRRLGGHIHPLTPYYLAYGALRAGLIEPSFHPDRVKASAVALALALWPLLRIGRLRHELRWRRKAPDVLTQNRALLAAQNGWALLTCRSTVLRLRKPSASGAAAPEDRNLPLTPSLVRRGNGAR
jgi:SAM-dependent methyltransferase